MSASALVLPRPGSEETEAVTHYRPLLVRGGIKVTTASVANDGNGDYLLARREAAGGCAAGRSG